MRILKIVKEGLFNLKYRLCLAQEGKDFYSCGQYEFCIRCSERNIPCCDKSKHSRSKKHPGHLKYVFCDDWLIFAIDSKKRLYYVVTEMWPEWLDIGEEKSEERNAVEKYMLPIAKLRWDSLPWKAADFDGYHEKFSYIQHYLWRMNLRYNLYYRWIFLIKAKLKNTRKTFSKTIVR